MAKKISNKDIFAGDLFKDTQKNAEALTAALQKMKSEIKEIAKINKQSATGKSPASMRAEDLKKLDKAQQQILQNAKDLEKLQKTEAELERVLRKDTEALAAAKIKLQKANKTQKDTLRDLLILEDKEAGTLEKLNARNRQLRREREKLNLDTEKGRRRLRDINKELDKNNARIKKNSDALKKQRLNVGNYAKGVGEGIKQSGLFSRQLQILNQVQAIFNAIIAKNTAEKEVNTIATVSQSKATRGLTTAQKGLAVATQFTSKTFKLLKGALISSGVGALVVALGSLIAFFTSTQRGADLLGQGVAGVTATFEALRDRASKVGEALVAIFTGIGESFKRARIQAKIFFLESTQFEVMGKKVIDNTDKIKALRKELEATGPGIKDGIDQLTAAFDGLGDEIAEETSAAIDLKRELQAIERLENDLLAVSALSRAEISKLGKTIKDVAIATEDRIAAAQKAIGIEEKLLQAQVVAQKKRLGNILAINTSTADGLAKVTARIEQIRKKSADAIGSQDVAKAIKDGVIALEEVGLGESLEEDRKQALEAVAKIFELEEKSFKAQTKLQAKLSSLREEDFKRRILIRQLELQLIDDQEQKEIEKENIRFDRVIFEAKKRNENIELLEEIHQAELEKIRAKFAAQREAELLKIAEKERAAEENLLKFRQSVNTQLAREEVDRLQAAEATQEEILAAIKKRTQAEIEEESLKNAVLLENEDLTSDDRIRIQEQEAEAIRQIRKKEADDIKAIGEKSKEDEAQRLEEQKELAIQLIDEVSKIYQERSEDRINAIDAEVEASKKREEEIRELARQGVVDAQENLAFEQKKQAELQREKEKEQKRQELREIGFAGLKAYVSNVEAGEENALGKTIQDMTILIAALRGVAGFIEGSDHVAKDLDPTLNTGKDDYLIRVDGAEKVFKPEHSKRIGYDMSNEEVTQVIERFKRGELTPDRMDALLLGPGYQNNDQLLAKVDSLQKTMEEMPKNITTQRIEYDEIERAVVTITERRGKITREHKKQKGVWG